MSFVPFIISIGLLLGALLLGVTSALAVLSLTQTWGRRVKGTLAFLAKGVVLFPLSALVWAAVGGWVGRCGWPVSSLMPAVADPALMGPSSRLAEAIWWWAPPVFLLALPLTCQLLAAGWAGRRPWHVQVRFAGLLGVVLLPVVEDALHLPAALAGIVPGLHSSGSASVAVVLWPLALLALGWWCLASAWPRDPAPYLQSEEDKIREGAVVIGFSPQEVWKRHLLRNQFLRASSRLCSAAAMGLTGWVAYGCPGNVRWYASFHAAFRAALADPLAPLLTAWPYALCALSLWVLGRIILPRSR